MAHRNFDSERNGRDREPVTFQACGMTFSTLSFIPTTVWEYDPNLTPVQKMGASIEALLIPEDVANWRMIRDPENREHLLSTEEMGNIYRWLLEELSDRPTGSRPTSSVGRESTEATSGGG